MPATTCAIIGADQMRGADDHRRLWLVDAVGAFSYRHYGVAQSVKNALCDWPSHHVRSREFRHQNDEGSENCDLGSALRTISYPITSRRRTTPRQRALAGL